MNAIFETIDKIEEGLGRSPHPAITDVPVGAWVVSGITDVMGMLTRDKAYDDCARISMGIGLIGAAGAALTGLHDYSYIPRDRQPSHDIATRHALNAAVTGTLYATSYVLRSRDEQAGRRTCFPARLLGLIGGGMLLYTAELGGTLVLKLGEAVKPMIALQEKQKQEPRKREPRSFGQEGDGAASDEGRRIIRPVGTT